MPLPTAQQALGFLESQMNYIEAATYRTRYAHIQYPLVVPVSTEADEWARGITWYSSDATGKAKIIAAAGQDVPRAQLDRSQHDVTVEMGGHGVRVQPGRVDDCHAQNVNLTADKGVACRRFSEELVDELVATATPTVRGTGCSTTGRSPSTTSRGPG